MAEERLKKKKKKEEKEEKEKGGRGGGGGGGRGRRRGGGGIEEERFTFHFTVKTGVSVHPFINDTPRGCQFKLWLLKVILVLFDRF